MPGGESQEDAMLLPAAKIEQIVGNLLDFAIMSVEGIVGPLLRRLSFRRTSIL